MQDLNRLVINITEGSRAAHAYIIEGRSGRPRDEFLLRLAAGLECSDSDPSRRPCGRCSACLQTAAGTCLDVVRMNKSTGSSKSARASYKVDDAAAFIERLSMGAYGRFLIGLIDDADTMSEVIQNKLLKTLEEPGADTLIFLAASNRDNLLSTVRSRCSEIRLDDYIESGEEVQPENLHGIVSMLTDRKSRFHEFREAADKYLKTREDALALLDMLDEDVRAVMTGESPAAEDMLRADSADELASVIELSAETRMDIRREMNHSRAVRRLYLELRRNGRIYR